jgi:uncharacterized protein (UPF0332 family)
LSSPEEVQANLDRADASLQAAQLLLDSELLDDAASRAYYAAFHAATALLLSQNLSFSSHTGVLRAINLNFVKTGQLDQSIGRNLNWLAELRQVGDYGETRRVSRPQAERAVAATAAFIAEVKSRLK